MTPDILTATRFSSDEALQTTLRLLRMRSSRYAWYGTFIASCAVVLACLLVAQHFHGGISYANVLKAQRENVAIWVLNGMPFLFALWGQAVSFRTTRDAGSAIKVRTSSLRRSLRKERLNTRLRTDYFARLSHEFRTPLNSILGLTEMLSNRTGTRPFEKDLRMIHEAADNLLGLINDVLDYSAIEAGHLDMDRVEFDLRECINNACALLRPQAEAKGLSLTVSIVPGVPHAVIGDPGRLRQVLVNIINNAIKFTTAGGVSCEVGHTLLEDRRHGMTITIRDTGIGMEPATLKRIFTPYGRAASNRRVEGSGLGLPICREIVDAMNGDISVESEPGKGSVFVVELAFIPGHGVSLAGIARNIELRGVRVLLVEAASDERARFESQLRALGMDVRLADDGVDAFKEILIASSQGRPYELLITDLFVEHMAGEELARALKARAETRETCLVATTSSGSRGDGKRVRQAGFSAYLTRPIPPEHLGDLLRATLATQAVSAEQREAINLITRHYIRENAPQEVAVLLVEDDPVAREITSRRLQSLGCRVSVAVNGTEALQSMREDQFSLVLLDHNLPDQRGDEVARALLEHATPIIMFSAGLTQAEKQRCLRAGALGFLEKPATREGLLSVLERYCQLPGIAEAPDGADSEVSPALRRVFLRESLTRMAGLEKAIGAVLDRDSIQRTAHTMRSSARHVHAERLAASFAALDELQGNGSEKAIRAKAAEVLKLWRETIELFEEMDTEGAEQTVRLSSMAQ